MKKIYFEYLNETILNTGCPYNIYGTPYVYSIVCGNCKHYNGKFNKENAIQCSGDEHLNIKVVYQYILRHKRSNNIILDRFLLAEKKIEIKK